MTTTGSTLIKRLEDGETELDSDEYKIFRTAIGKLMWLALVRPDINFATQEMARTVQSPTSEHLAALKHLLRYLAGTCNCGLMLKPTHVLPKPSVAKTSLEIHTYCDSDWAGCKLSEIDFWLCDSNHGLYNTAL